MTYPTEPIEVEMPLISGDLLEVERWSITLTVTAFAEDDYALGDAVTEIASLPREREVCELIQQLSEVAHRFREEWLEG